MKKTRRITYKPRGTSTSQRQADKALDGLPQAGFYPQAQPTEQKRSSTKRASTSGSPYADQAAKALSGIPSMGWYERPTQQTAVAQRSAGTPANDSTAQVGAVLSAIPFWQKSDYAPAPAPAATQRTDIGTLLDGISAELKRIFHSEKEAVEHARKPTSEKKPDLTKKPLTWDELKGLAE